MKNSSKILAFTLLLAVVVSLFAILPAFAADSSDLQPEVVFDLDSYEDGEVILNKEGPTITKELDAAGNEYWIVKTNVSAGATIGNGSTYIRPLSTNVFPSTGSTIVQGENKNTDFLVVDFDIASDSNFISSLTLQTRFDKKSAEPSVKGSSYDEIYVSSASGNGYSTELPTDEWVHVTFIYDCSAASAGEWKAYAYINGYYAGGITAINSESTVLNGFRFVLAESAIYDNESLKLRDLTYTKFPVGWDGDMTDKLGKNSITLDYVEELSYYSKGYNTPRFDNETPVATIKRGEEEIPVYNVYDLDANFVDGDTVTLHRNIDIPLVVNATGVKFEGDYTYNLVDTSTITDWSGVGYIALDATTRTYVKHGTLAEFSTGAVPAKDTPLVYILLGDADLALRLQTIQVNGYTVYDLNGYTLNFKPTKSGRIFSPAENGVIRFQNGKLTCSDITESIAQLSIECAFTLQNVDLSNFNPSNGFLFNHRVGLVLLKNAAGYASTADYVTGLTLNGDYSIGLVYDGVVLTDAKYHTQIENKKTNGVAYIAYKNCDINCSESLVYGYSALTTAFETKINIFVSNSKIKGSDIFYFRFTGEPGNDTKVDVDIDIVDSTLNGSTIHRVREKSAANDYKYNANITVEGNSAINTTGAFFRVAANHAGTTINMYAEEGVKVLGKRDVNYNGLANGALYDLATGEPANIGHNGKNYITTPSNCVTYKYIDYKNQTEKEITVIEGASVDSAIKTLRRTESAGEYDAYRWKMNADGVYEIDVIPNFNISANLTLYKDISLNIFIDRVLDSEDLAAVAFDVLGSDGNYTVSEYNGQTKIQVVVTPENIDKVYTVQVKINEWNTEAYTSELPVTREIKISVASYCDNMIAKYGADSELGKLMNAIIAYGNAAEGYIEGTLTDDPDVNYGDPVDPGESEAFEDINLNLASGFIWEIKVAKGVESVTVKYYYDGEEKTVDLVPNADNIICISLKAFDLAKDITLTAGEEIISFNFAFYADELIKDAAEEDKENLKGILDAIWNYATAAAEYKMAN